MRQKILQTLLIGSILISSTDLSIKTFGLQSPESSEAIKNEAQLNQNGRCLFNIQQIKYFLHH